VASFATLRSRRLNTDIVAKKRKLAVGFAKLIGLDSPVADLFPGISYRKWFDKTVPETEIEQLDIGIHAEL